MLTQKEVNDYVDRGKIIFRFDIDDTLIEFETHKPIRPMVDHIRKLYREGHYIYISTARPEDKRVFTEKQLFDFKIPYGELIMGSPKCHLTVDDATVNTLDYMKNMDYYDELFRKLGYYYNHKVRERGI